MGFHAVVGGGDACTPRLGGLTGRAVVGTGGIHRSSQSIKTSSKIATSIKGDFQRKSQNKKKYAFVFQKI